MKKTHAMIFCLIGILLISSQSSVIVATSASTPCDMRLAVARVPSPNTPLVLSLVQSTAQYEALVGRLTFNGMAYESHGNDLTCTVKPYAIDVEYAVSNSNGTQSILAFKLDANGTRVLNTWTENALYATAQCNPQYVCSPNAIWSGYESSYPSSGTKVEQMEATMNWVQPSVNVPGGSGQPDCGYTRGSPNCGLAIWSGLTNQPTGYQGTLLQAGSFGLVQCAVRCAINYQLWYEKVPSSPAYFCSFGSTNPGDGVESYVYSATLVGGSNGQWYLFVQDHNNGNICQPTNPFSNSFIPLYAEFQAERPCQSFFFGQCVKQYSLPYFSTYNPEGRMYYNNGIHGLSCNGCGQNIAQILMENPVSSSGVTNILNSVITDTGTGWGQFTNTWQTSQNT